MLARRVVKMCLLAFDNVYLKMFEHALSEALLD